MPEPISQETIDKIAALEALGVSRTKIAKQLGICCRTIARHFPRKIRTCSKITDEMKEKMRTFRAQGLSNSKIAIELGISETSVIHHLGKQPDGVHAAYGEIVSHATGDSFEIKGESRLKKISTTVAYSGDRFNYKVENTGLITFCTSPTGSIISLSREELGTFITELTELKTWLDNNAPVMLLDGRPKSQLKQLP